MESIDRKGYITDNILQQNFMIHIMDHLFSLGYERKVLGNSELTYSFWYNLIFINLYFLIVKQLRQIDETGNVTFKHLDLDADCKEELLVDLCELKTKLFSRLDQYYKGTNKKRGITIIKNTYTGFDTEYQFFNFRILTTSLFSL